MPNHIHGILIIDKMETPATNMEMPKLGVSTITTNNDQQTNGGKNDN